MPLPPPVDDQLTARIEALVNSSGRPVRRWRPKEIEVVSLSIERGLMTPPLMGVLYLALRAEVSGRSWFDEDAFEDRFLHFYTEWLVEVAEKEKKEVEGKDGKKKRVTVYVTDASGKPVRDEDGRRRPVLKEPYTVLSPLDIAKRFVTSVRNKPRDWHRQWGGRTAGADLLDWQRAPDALAQLKARSEINHLLDRLEGLDDTNLRILALLAEEATPKEVAEQLDLNGNTVRSRIKRIRDGLAGEDEAAAK